MEAPSVVQSAPVLATPLVHVHVFARGVDKQFARVQRADGYIQTCASCGRVVDCVTGRTARAHGGIVGTAISAGLDNAVGTRAHVL